MSDDEFIIPLRWPRGSLKLWLTALATVAALGVILYAVFSWAGW